MSEASVRQVSTRSNHLDMLPSCVMPTDIAQPIPIRDNAVSTFVVLIRGNPPAVDTFGKCTS